MSDALAAFSEPPEEPPYDWALEEPIAVVANGRSPEEHPEIRKVAWEERSEHIRKRFASVEQLNWEVALERDIDLFGRVVRDILKLEQAVPGRPGPRPSLDVHDAIRRMQQLLGKDFTLQDFPEALKVLARGKSTRQLAHHVGLNRNEVQRLLAKQMYPNGYQLRACAEAFGKHPSYFLEWRILYIVAAIVRRLEWSPEATVGIFRRLDYQRKLARD